MIRAAFRKAASAVTSAAFVSAVLAFIGLWSVIASFIPQGEPSSSNVVAWAEANQALEPIVRAVGLHEAFSTWIFLVVVGLLALSTVLCSWQRTKAAVVRVRILSAARHADAAALLDRHDVRIPCGSRCAPAEVLERAAGALRDLGITVHRSEDRLVSTSPPWGIWGSPVFHWSLVALMVFVLAGGLFRSQGLIGLAVGQVKPDAPESYGKLSAGPLHDWDGITHSFRLDAFEPRFTADGIDRGPVPTVSVLDEAGSVIKTQPVYPNHMLHYGRVSVNAPAYGLAVRLSLTDDAGIEVGQTVQLVDFQQSAPDGTSPLGVVPVLDETGDTSAVLHVTVPLVREGGQYVEWLPKESVARVVGNSAEGAPLFDELLGEGEAIGLPGELTLRVTDIGWYSRLSVVNDWTRPYIYACMVIATLALTATVVFRQQYLIAATVAEPDGTALLVRLRLWRNSPTTRDEIERELRKALAADGEGGAS